jgi:acetyl-CoA acyltransferase 1
MFSILPHLPLRGLPSLHACPQIVVTACLRTAFTKGGKGGFKDTAAADLLVGAFKSLIERSKIDPSLVEDIAVGSVLPPGGGATEFRAAALAAGFPVTAAVKALNRQCSSGLQACVDIANAISAGMIEVGVGAGVESMSLQYGYVWPFPLPFFRREKSDMEC